MKSAHFILTPLCMVIAFVLAGSNLYGQAAPAGTPLTMRGKINSVKGAEVLVATSNGDVSVKLADSTTVRGEVPVKLSEIQPGMYAGTSAQKGPDGILRASEINIFSEDQRGQNEGHRPQTSRPGSTMTNAHIEKVEETTVQDVKGPLLTLKYKGGEVKVLVPPETRVVKRVPGDRQMLKPGAAVVVQATQSADGIITASRFTVDVSGDKPK